MRLYRSRFTLTDCTSTAFRWHAQRILWRIEDAALSLHMIRRGRPQWFRRYVLSAI